MGWASKYIERLKLGEAVQFRPTGGSMRGKIESGQLVTVEPLVGNPSKGDIVLCRVNGREYLHLVKGTKTNGHNHLYQIGNNRGGVNGWVGRSQIFGIVTKVE